MRVETVSLVNYFALIKNKDNWEETNVNTTIDRGEKGIFSKVVSSSFDPFPVSTIFLQYFKKIAINLYLIRMKFKTL